MTPTDLRILDTCHLPPARREHVAAELGMMAVQYHQRLNALIDDPAAEEARPVVVHRLRRLREARRASRSRRRLGSTPQRSMRTG